jgi:hypothetical protein
MKMGLAFVQELVVGFGFLNGLWICVGVNPESEILGVFLTVGKTLMPQFSGLWTLEFFLIEAVSIAVPTGVSFVTGGWVGILAVALAFIGGTLIRSIGVYLLIIALVLGLFAPGSRSHND